MALYLYIDPFCLFLEPETPFATRFPGNKGLTTVRAFEKGNPRYRYNSFIIGSSISMHYRIDDWLKYLPEGASPFHLDSSMQSVRCTRLFLEYLEKNAAAIDNVLIVFTPFIFESADEDEPVHTYATPPQIMQSVCDKAKFHYRFFRDFANYDFFSQYSPLSSLGEDSQSALPTELDHNNFNSYIYDPATNEVCNPALDKLIDESPDEYYASHEIIDFDLKAPYHEVKPLTDSQKEDLRIIAAILKKHNTNFKILLTPELMLRTISPEDDAFFHSLFTDNFVNLTREFRDEMRYRTNYYDNPHYRPALADKYMNRAYRGNM
ncbi:MAG: hypothetical protein NC402_05685 [Prevotella sp.]|nr:hypothetical protein [Prevotella sp.]MCM1074577.1 hypothetical protein [Ruminococcus sp.]